MEIEQQLGIRAAERPVGELGQAAIMSCEMLTDEIDMLLDDLENRDYTETRQPVYPDRAKLRDAMQELSTSASDTSMESVMTLRTEFEAIASGASESLIRIVGRCNDRVDIHQDIGEVAREKISLVDAIHIYEPDSLVIVRTTTEKPRSDAVAYAQDGRKVLPYCGDGINSEDEKRRTPDPDRLVAVNAQIRSVGEALAAHYDKHIPTARETLSIPYMVSMMREEEGQIYSAESDVLWLGDRTRQLDGIHVNVLADLQPVNSIGVKIGPGATPEDIIGLSEKLNPKRESGKLIFMFRMGTDQLSKLHPLLRAVREHASEALLIYDLHGATEKKNGQKVRNVTKMIEETWIVASMCERAGLRLHGTHVEAIGTNKRKECIDDEDDRPTHENFMDPQLNLAQLKRYHSETAKVF